MKFKVYVVELNMPRWARSLLAAAMAVCACAGVTIGAVAIARANLPAGSFPFVDGGTLRSGDLNADLGNLDQRVSILEGFKNQITADGGYSVGSRYCGSTPPTNGQITNGYTGVKALCASVCGASAHMCSPEDMVRSAQLGVVPSVPGWITTTTSFNGCADVGGTCQPANAPVWDCLGWSTSGSTYAGALYPTNNAACNSSYPVLCCD